MSFFCAVFSLGAAERRAEEVIARLLLHAKCRAIMSNPELLCFLFSVTCGNMMNVHLQEKQHWM